MVARLKREPSFGRAPAPGCGGLGGTVEISRVDFPLLRDVRSYFDDMESVNAPEVEGLARDRSDMLQGFSIPHECSPSMSSRKMTARERGASIVVGLLSRVHHVGLSCDRYRYSTTCYIQRRSVSSRV